MKIKIRELFNNYRNIILYGLIGGFCAALDFGIFSLLSLIIPYQLSNIISVHCGIICSFFLNRSINFKVKDSVGIRFVSFYLVGLSGLVISELLIILLTYMCGFNHLISKLFTVVIVAVFQFLLNKYLTFKKHSHE